MSVARTWIRIILFTILVVVLAVASAARPSYAGGLIACVALGAGLGIYGIGRTRFEASGAGLFYTPNAHIGIALSLLFVGRMVYRFLVVRSFDADAMSGSTELTGSLMTLAIFGLLAGYYVSYAIGLLRWRASVAGTVSKEPEPAALAPTVESPGESG